MTASLGQMSASISLPPISAINFDQMQQNQHQMHAHEMAQHSMPHQPARTLPPLPYYSNITTMPQPEYVQPARAIYSMHNSPYGLPIGARMQLPSSAETAALMGYGPNRHAPKNKDVKRRTKTGCMTCRKRRIKVSNLYHAIQSSKQPHWLLNNNPHTQETFNGSSPHSKTSGITPEASVVKLKRRRTNEIHSWIVSDLSLGQIRDLMGLMAYQDA